MTVRPPGQPDRSVFSGEELEAYDWVVQRERNRGEADGNGRINRYYGSLLHSPTMCSHVSGLGRWVRLVGDRGDSFTHADREWVDQVLSKELGSTTVIAGHLEDALVQGVRLEAIRALWDGEEELFTERERLTADYVRQVYRGTVTDETYAAIQDLLGVKGAVEYTIWVLYLHMTIRAIEAVTGGRGPGADAVRTKIKSYLDGTLEIPTRATYQAG